MKCLSCGKDMGNKTVCKNCGFDSLENKRVKKLLNEKEDKTIYDGNTDLLDYPILSFILGILSLILPIFIFSFLAIKLAKKPAKPSYEPFQNLGRVLGFFGLGVSTVLTLYIIFSFII